MVDDIFDWCVHLQLEVSAIMGMTYEELNVYLFVVVSISNNNINV